MKFLSSLILILISPWSLAGVVTTVQSDWTTYRVDLVTDTNYSIFGGGLAGDVFHIFFDFNRAYLPYATEINSEWQRADYSDFMRYGIPDRSTADPDDALVFDALPLVGSQLRFEINGVSYSTVSPFQLTLQNGQISGFGTGVFAPFNFMFDSATTFMMTDARMTSDLRGHLGGIVDTDPGLSADTSTVPEPGVFSLLLLGLAGMMWQRARWRN